MKVKYGKDYTSISLILSKDSLSLEINQILKKILKYKNLNYEI